jgi:hypothetical protein
MTTPNPHRERISFDPERYPCGHPRTEFNTKYGKRKNGTQTKRCRMCRNLTRKPGPADRERARRRSADAHRKDAAADLYNALNAIVAEADNSHGDSIAVTALAQRIGRPALAKARGEPA